MNDLDYEIDISDDSFDEHISIPKVMAKTPKKASSLRLTRRRSVLRSTLSFQAVPPPYLRPIKIGERFASQDTFCVENTPGPGSYEVSKTILTPKTSHLIADKIEEKIDMDIPGPGKYDSRLTPKIKGGSMPTGVVDRSCWLGLTDTPGPGNYEPEEKPKKKEKMVAIDKFLINLKCFKDPAAANETITKMPIIRAVLEEISTAVLKEKPENPLEFLAKYFDEHREADGTFKVLPVFIQQKKKHFVGSVDVSILYD